LRTEKAKLLDEIQALRAKLHELDAAGKMGAGSGPMAAPAAVPPSADPLISQGRVVILNRADENGHIYQEAWTTDANGKPSKIVKRSEVPGDSPITAATAGMSDGKRVVKMFKGKNGPVWIHTYDAESGKLIETREANAAETASVTPGSVDPTRANPTPNVDQAPDQSPGPSISVRRGQPETAQFPAKYPPAFVAVPGSDAPPEVKVWNEKNGPGPVLIARTADGAAANVSDRPIDLITLATSYADAVGAVELAKAKLAEAESGGQTGELRSRRAALENAVRKEKLLRRIAEVATAGAKQNYERLVKLHGQGVVSADMLDESKSRLDILSQILDTRGDTPAESNSAQPK
jgi:hypothetical protein